MTLQKVIYSFLLFIPIFVIVFFGRYISETYLETSPVIYAQTTTKVNSAVITFNKETMDKFTSPRIAHEMLHATKAFGLILRDVPTAAAMEYLIDYEDNKIQDAQIENTIRNTVAEKKHQWEGKSEIAFRNELLVEADALVEKYDGRLESTASYYDSAKLVGLIQFIGKDKDERGTFLGMISLGAPASLAYKAMKNPAYKNWIVSRNDNLHYTFVDSMYDLRAVITHQDITDMKKNLAIVPSINQERAAILNSEIEPAMRRITKKAYDKIFGLGSKTFLFTKTESSTVRSASWVKRPSLRINLEPPHNHFTGPSLDLISKIENGTQQITKAYSEVRGRNLIPFIEKGKFKRNQIEEGYIYIQWSDMIQREAETVVLLNNSEIVGVLITIHISCNYLPVILQEIYHAFGSFEHAKPNKNSTIYEPLQNPLPRPAFYFQNSGYTYFKAKDLSKYIKAEN